VREHALSLVERLPEDPRRLNLASYLVASKPNLDAAKYRHALRQAEAARDLARSGWWDFWQVYHPDTVIGMAHYRLGEYREAVEALTASEAFYVALGRRTKPGTVWNLPFLAMAHHGLGEREEARAVLARLREIMKSPAGTAWASNADYQGFLREAEELVDGASPDSRK
jgi:hypothetical protein